MSLLDQSNDEPTPMLSFFWPLLGGIIERAGDGLGLGDHMSGTTCWHAPKCITWPAVLHPQMRETVEARLAIRGIRAACDAETGDLPSLLTATLEWSVGREDAGLPIDPAVGRVPCKPHTPLPQRSPTMVCAMHPM